MSIKAFLFDLDGTLADTALVNAKAYSVALAEVGVHIDVIQFAQIASGKNWRQFLPALLESAGVKVDPSAIAERKSFLYAGMIGEVLINVPLIMLLNTCRPQIKTALVTTASGANARAIMDFHGLTGLFDVVVTGDDVVSHKPDPEAYHLATERLKLSAMECIAFEDSDIGIASAFEAGMSVVHITFP
jgi:beta-phosphoglucomutase-like phosphatase (HAD superfamily)